MLHHWTVYELKNYFRGWYVEINATKFKYILVRAWIRTNHTLISKWSYLWLLNSLLLTIICLVFQYKYFFLLRVVLILEYQVLIDISSWCSYFIQQQPLEDNVKQVHELVLIDKHNICINFIFTKKNKVNSWPLV